MLCPFFFCFLFFCFFVCLTIFLKVAACREISVLNQKSMEIYILALQYQWEGEKRNTLQFVFHQHCECFCVCQHLSITRFHRLYCARSKYDRCCESRFLLRSLVAFCRSPIVNKSMLVFALLFLVLDQMLLEVKLCCMGHYGTWKYVVTEWALLNLFDDIKSIIEEEWEWAVIYLI